MTTARQAIWQKLVGLKISRKDALKVRCPKCGTVKAFRCVGSKGQVRKAPHAERFASFLYGEGVI